MELHWITIINSISHLIFYEFWYILVILITVKYSIEIFLNKLFPKF